MDQEKHEKADSLRKRIKDLKYALSRFESGLERYNSLQVGNMDYSVDVGGKIKDLISTIVKGSLS